MTDVIMFVFGGRRANLEIAIPFYRRILDENPKVELHLWDLARDPKDSQFMRSLPTSDRFQVRADFYQGDGRAMRGQNQVWKHYTADTYRDYVFVKADDDDLFFDTNRFGDFINAVQDNDVLSALTINNGASTPYIPDLWDMYQQLPDVPALPDWGTRTGPVHLSATYAERCHRWFCENWQTLTATPGQPTAIGDDWLSINLIAYTWATGRRIAQTIGKRHPPRIAGRRFARGTFGDEGAANTLPRRVHTGFVAAHFGFGPQKFEPDVATELRKLYADLADQYL